MAFLDPREMIVCGVFFFEICYSYTFCDSVVGSNYSVDSDAADCKAGDGA